MIIGFIPEKKEEKKVEVKVEKTEKKPTVRKPKK